jgi:hypothetical protein
VQLTDAPAPPWAHEVISYLESLGYDAICNREAAVAWIQHRGRIDACPVVEREDWPAVNAIVCRARPTPVEPEPTSDLPFEPSSADRLWWAVNSNRPASTPTVRVIRHRRAFNTLTDEDIVTMTGCCG